MGAFNPVLDEDSDGFEINPPTVPLSSSGVQQCCTKRLNRPMIVAAGEAQPVENNGPHKYCYDPVLLEFLSRPNFGTYDTSAPYSIAGTDVQRRLITDAPRNIIPEGYEMRFGEDIFFGEDRGLPVGMTIPSMACTEIVISRQRGQTIYRPSCEPHWQPPWPQNTPRRDEKNMRRWLEDLRLIYSRNDSSGITAHAFNAMFCNLNDPRPRDAVKYYTTRNLNSMINVHENINSFCDLILNAPPNNTARTRIHQALRTANWDINNIQRVTDFGLPALNNYVQIPTRNTGLNPLRPLGEDANNGLTLLIHDFANVAVVATNYCYCEQENKYDIDLLYLFYDLFGIDTDDIDEFGFASGTDAFEGLKAWYYLQRMKGYAPHITRNVVFRSFRGIDAV